MLSVDLVAPSIEAARVEANRAIVSNGKFETARNLFVEYVKAVSSRSPHDSWLGPLPVKAGSKGDLYTLRTVHDSVIMECPQTPLPVARWRFPTRASGLT